MKSYTDVYQHEKLLWKGMAPRPERRLRGVLWHRCADSGQIEGEPFIEVKNGVVCPAETRVTELPGAYGARAFSSLDDDEAEDTYVGLGRWISARGYQLAGPRREIYRGKLLEIQYPLRTD